MLHRVRWIERLLIAVGVWALAWVWIESLEAESFRRRLEASTPLEIAGGNRTPDVVHRSAVVGRLEIPRLEISHVVAEGDSDAILDAAIGHLPETPLPWEPGNSVLAGHRDGVFRPLKDVRIGDALRMTTPAGDLDYVITETLIVRPQDTWVLEPSGRRTLTLVTCYPFSYFGAAPYRFVVRAEPRSADGPRVP